MSDRFSGRETENQEEETNLDSKNQFLENAEENLHKTKIQRNRRAHWKAEEAEVMIESSDTILRFDSS